MTNQEIAAYLVDLHTLLEAQNSSANAPSAAIALEYEKHWAMFKDQLAKETTHESNHNLRTETAAQGRGNQPELRQSNRPAGSSGLNDRP